MSFTNQTPFLGLPQWLNTDIPAWESDVNNAFSKIDQNAQETSTTAQEAKTAADTAVVTANNAVDIAGKGANWIEMFKNVVVSSSTTGFPYTINCNDNLLKYKEFYLIISGGAGAYDIQPAYPSIGTNLNFALAATSFLGTTTEIYFYNYEIRATINGTGNSLSISNIFTTTVRTNTGSPVISLQEKQSANLTLYAR